MPSPLWGKRSLYSSIYTPKCLRYRLAALPQRGQLYNTPNMIY